MYKWLKDNLVGRNFVTKGGDTWSKMLEGRYISG